MTAKGVPRVGARVTLTMGRATVKNIVVLGNSGFVDGFKALPVQDGHGSGRRGVKRAWPTYTLFMRDEGLTWARGWNTRAANALRVAGAL